MPTYRIFRLKETQRDSFRSAPHTAGVTVLKPRDYHEEGATDAPTPYAAWSELREAGRPLEVGDVLSNEDGSLRICKYVGFEEARWFVPEVEQPQEAASQPLQAG
jgi:hypothetical protein